VGLKATSSCVAGIATVCSFRLEKNQKPHLSRRAKNGAPENPLTYQKLAHPAFSAGLLLREKFQPSHQSASNTEYDVDHGQTGSA
jgi:hypothetical protein